MKPEQQLSQIDRLTKPMESKFARAYHRFIEKIRPKVVGNVKRGGAPDAAAHKKQLPRTFTSIYRDDIEASRSQADKQIGKGKPAKEQAKKDGFTRAHVRKARRRRLTPLEEGASREIGVAGTSNLPYATGATFDVDDLIEESLARLGRTLDTLDDRLERVLADAPDDLTDDELADLIDEEFDLFEDEGKIESIAETEVFGSVNGGRAQAFADNGVEWGTWGTMQDNKVRETHRDFGESGVHPIGFNYAKLTDTPETLLRWPHDVECEEASLVCNCRCALLWTDAPDDAEDIYDEEMGDLGDEDKGFNPDQPRQADGKFGEGGGDGGAAEGGKTLQIGGKETKLPPDAVAVYNSRTHRAAIHAPGCQHGVGGMHLGGGPRAHLSSFKPDQADIDDMEERGIAISVAGCAHGKGFNPDQPRVPAGQPGGGQFGSGGGAERVSALEGELASREYRPDRWEPVRGRQGPPSPDFARHRVHLELSHLRRDLATAAGETPRTRPRRERPAREESGAPTVGPPPAPNGDSLAGLSALTAKPSNIELMHGDWDAVSKFAQGTSLASSAATPAQAAATRATWAAMVGAPPGATVRIGPGAAGRQMSVSFRRRGRDEDYTASRTIFKNADGTLSVENHSFKIEAGPAGLGMDVFERQVRGLTLANEGKGGEIRTYGAGTPDTGVERIFGDRSDYSNGYYTWARFGYDANINRGRFSVPSAAFDNQNRNLPHPDKPEEWRKDPPAGGFTGPVSTGRKEWESQFLGSGAGGKERVAKINAEVERAVHGYTPGTLEYRDKERQARRSALNNLIEDEYAKAGSPTRMSGLNKAGSLWLHKAFGSGIDGNFNLKKDSYSQLNIAAYRAERKLRAAKKAEKKDYNAQGEELPIIPGVEWTPQFDADDEAFLDLIAQVMDDLPPEMQDDPDLAEEVVRRIHKAYTDPEHEPQS